MENIVTRKEAPHNFSSPGMAQPPPIPPSRGKTDPAIAKISEDMTQALRTLRMLEDRYSTIRKKMQMSDQNMIEDTNKVFTQLKVIVKDITDLKIKVEDMRVKLGVFENEIKDMADKQDLKVLQRYVELWQPMDFMTEKQAIQLIRVAMKQYKEMEDIKKP